MEKLADQQKKLGESIQQLVTNYQKAPASRKTITYLEERRQRLDAQWDEFENTDNVIRCEHDSRADHPYFTSDYYTAINKIYTKYREEITLKIESMSGTKQPSDQSAGTNPPDQPDHDEEGTQATPVSQPPTTGSLGALPKQPSRLPKSQAEDSFTAKISHQPMSPLSKTIRRHRARVDSLFRLLEAVSSEDQEQKSKQYYQHTMRNIERYWSQIENINLEVWELTDDPIAAGYDLQEVMDLEQQVHSTLIHLAECADRQPTSEVCGNPTNSSAMKLPKIIIPIFDGNYLTWRQFYDLFTQMVHNQPMSGCQKMWYLKTNLRGEAEKLIRHLSLSNENYSAAWELLKARYENIRLLVTALLNKLMGQPKLHTESSTGIKSLHDTTKETLMGLENLNVPTNNWDPLLLHILVGKLDRATHVLYEQSLSQPRALQTVDHFLNLLENRFQSLEAIGNKSKSNEELLKRTHQTARKANTLVSTTPTSKCASCSKNHELFMCQNFMQLTPADRLKLLRKNNLCVNCMRPGHGTFSCTLRGCTICNKKHNTLVHLQSNTVKTNTPQLPINPTIEHSKVDPIRQSISLTTQGFKPHKSYVLLSTVKVRITTEQGRSVECRAILDSGSQVNLITERILKKLDLKGIPDIMQVQGIGQGRQQSQQRVSVTMQSRVTGFSTRLEAFVLKQILPAQPSQAIDTASWSIPNNIALADPSFNQPSHIDLLIGAEHYHQLLCIGQIKIGNGLPILQNTTLGWVVSGKLDNLSLNNPVCSVFCTNEDMDQQLERFWRIEEAPEEKSSMTTAERHCEEYFNCTFRRTDSGHFVVKLPFLDNPHSLGESRDIATRRFMAIERKLTKDKTLRTQYVDFMNEYQRLGHMTEIDIDEVQAPCYFIPHHCVSKPDSTTTKLRVVFDASCKTSSNLSLNDLLATGPTIQDELFAILLRFRLPKYVFSADIEKMYRQILVDENDRRFQLILWRSDPSQALKCYQLNTVTYGTTSAPYLATKCLQRLAQDEAATMPLGTEVLARDFYVDDLMSGANNLTTAVEIQSQLRKVLSKGRFNIRKWCSNHPQLLKNIPPADRGQQLTFDKMTDEQIKVLGLIWSPASDSFQIQTTWSQGSKVTKRIVCSDVARIFDPIGIMSPVVITAKIFLQELWLLKLDWDASLPMEMHTKWLTFRESLQALNDVKFPRHVFAQSTPEGVEIHAFADASQKAYGAAIYVRSHNSNKQIIVRLLCSKSKVAPIKQVTLPRLELCAAKLAVELTNRVKRDLRLKTEPTFFWTDSEIVLNWINSTSSSYQTFVANRIAAIQSLSLASQWRHVNSKHNPADLLTRGIAPEQLKGCALWFYGPFFLHGAEDLWPQPFRSDSENTLEKKRIALPVTTKTILDTHFVYNIDHRNSFGRLKRITAYILRFIDKLRKKSSVSNQCKGPTMQELHQALLTIVAVMQGDHFRDEIEHLKQFKELKKNNALISLAPFLDERGIIRVGGRLQAADLPYDAKHPILLPYSHALTKLLMSEIHIQHMHIGPQTILAITRQHFWPIKGKTIARAVVQQCVRCSRARPTMLSQMMGNLPPQRVQPARPFVNTGIDFCGPIWTHFKIRGKRPQKSYIAVFCCFATKAAHLEVVSDLTTQAFIGALKRFMARRGYCRNIYCDNATNFVGAKNELKELQESVYAIEAKTKIDAACGTHGTDFHFIPPRAPHFGGLWEAAVKSAKHLLIRTVGNASLTYEELETVVVEIESILNSRPLTPMSSNPNDLSALTPGHFLIGEPLTSTIDPEAEPRNVTLAARWRLIAHLKNEFWKRWSREYLNELQQRNKWKHSSPNVQPGTLVIIKDDNLPSLKWPLGRIIKVIKGDDGLARVADIQVKGSVIRRPIHKLAPLPIQTEDTVTGHNEPPRTADDGANQLNEAPSNDTTTPTVDTPAKQAGQQAPRKRARLSVGHAITTLLITCLLLPSIATTSSTPIAVTSFKGQPGLHFENLGPASIISDEWKLIVYYDLTGYWKEVEGFARAITALQDLCNSITKDKSCETIIAQLTHMSKEITTENQLLLPHAPRIKRGAMNFVGSIANVLFGVLDEEYAEKISQTINDVNSNQEQLHHLIKNQTSLLDATVNIMQKDRERVDQQFKNLEAQVNSILKQTHSVAAEKYEENLKVLFTTLAIQAMLIASNIQRAQSSIIDVLADTHHGQANPQLITPDQLRQELFQIKAHLAPHVRLTIEPSNILKLYTIMKVAARSTGRHIIFKLNIPLLALEKFELFHIVPIPALINNTFISIQPSSPFLIINLHRDTYYPLAEAALRFCFSMEEEHHICRQTHPLYKKGSSVSSCEVDLINEMAAPTTCHLTTLTGDTQWIQLHKQNEWIFAVKDKMNLKIVCGSNVTSTSIEGSGILAIQENCAINNKHVTIQGHNMQLHTSRISYSATSPISKFAKPEQIAALATQVQPFQLNQTELHELRDRINHQLLIAETSMKIRPHDVHQLSIGYIAAAVAVTTAVWLIWKFRPRICEKRTPKPTPRPRQHTSSDFSINVDT